MDILRGTVAMGEICGLNWEHLLETLGYGVLCLRDDETLTISYASDIFYRHLGYKTGEVAALLEPGREPVLRNDAPVNWAQVKAEIRKNGYAQPELRLIKKDGHHIWAAYRVQLTPGKDGVEYFCGIISDITLTRRSLREQREQAKELAALTANVPGGVMCCQDDKDMTLNLISDGFCRITGFTRKEIADTFQDRFIQMVYPKDRGQLMRQMEDCRRRDNDNIVELTYRIVGRDGKVIWVIDKTRMTADCNGNMWFYSVLVDITEKKKAEDELVASEERYRLILEHMADPVFDYDFKKMRAYYSPVFLEKFGGNFPHRGELYQTLELSNYIFPQDREKMLKNLKRLSGGEDVGDVEYRMRIAKGDYIWCNFHPVMFYDGQGAPTRLIAVISDIDRQKKENIVLRQKAEHDLLTGLYNRVTTTDLVDEAIASSGRGARHALFVADLDNFKKVNDNLGHLCGDQLIVQTAMQIRRQFREDDIIGRIGGDEFVIFLKNINSELILRKAEILQRAFKGLTNALNMKSTVSGSVGIALYPVDGKTYDELFRKADIALYTAKNNGKNSYRIYMNGLEPYSHIGISPKIRAEFLPE